MALDPRHDCDPDHDRSLVRVGRRHLHVGARDSGTWAQGLLFHDVLTP